MGYIELNSFTLVLVAVGIVVVVSRWLISKLRIGDIPNKFVFITGCDTGFGNLLAKRLDAAGVRVIAGCLTDAGRANVEKETSTRLTAVRLDVADKCSVEEAVRVVEETVKGHGMLSFFSMLRVMKRTGISCTNCGPTNVEVLSFLTMLNASVFQASM